MKYYSLITNKNCVQNNSKEFDMHPNIFMHHVNFDGYFLTVEIEKTCVMSYSNVSLSEEASLNERCKLTTYCIFFYSKIIFFRSSCTYSHRCIPSTPLSFFLLPSVRLPLHTNFPFIFLGLMRVWFEKAYVPMYDC